MNKRQGTEVKPVPTKVIQFQPGIEISSNQEIISPSYSPLSTQVYSKMISWEETKEMMQGLINIYDSEEDFSLVHQAHSLIKKIESHTTEKTIPHVNNIKSSYLKRIEQAEKAKYRETDELDRHERYLTSLENELESLKVKKHEITTKKYDSLERTEKYKEEIKSEEQTIDKTEASRLAEVPKIKQQISNYATLTGIKWYFDKNDNLEGEVAIPHKHEVHRFSFSIDDYSDVELANELWDMMDGKIKHRNSLT